MARANYAGEERRREERGEGERKEREGGKEGRRRVEGEKREGALLRTTTGRVHCAHYVELE